MTVLRYNHNSLLLIRASHLVPPLLFVVSMVPWVCITLPRQTRRKALTLLHQSNKSCWISARSSPRALLPSSRLQYAFLHGVLFFSFLEQEWGSLTHSPSLGTSCGLLSTSRGKRSHFYYVWKKGDLFGVHLNQLSAMDVKKGPGEHVRLSRWSPSSCLQSPPSTWTAPSDPAGWQSCLQPAQDFST